MTDSWTQPQWTDGTAKLGVGKCVHLVSVCWEHTVPNTAPGLGATVPNKTGVPHLMAHTTFSLLWGLSGITRFRVSRSSRGSWRWHLPYPHAVSVLPTLMFLPRLCFAGGSVEPCFWGAVWININLQEGGSMTVDDIYVARTACQVCSKHIVILTCRIPPTSIVLAFFFWGGQDTQG